MDLSKRYIIKRAQVEWPRPPGHSQAHPDGVRSLEAAEQMLVEAGYPGGAEQQLISSEYIVIKKLVKLASDLDLAGLYEEANFLEELVI